MKNSELSKIAAIWQREIKALFITPIGYVFIALFVAVMNLMFYMFNVMEATASVESRFSSMLVVLMFITPLLTMKLFSEEFKQKTDQLLFTSPVKVSSIVFSKFLAAFTIYAMALATVVITWLIIMYSCGNPNLPSIIGNVIATLCSGAAFIAIGLLISSLTKNQVIAATVSFAVYMMLFLLDFLAMNINITVIKAVIQWLSLFSRYNRFSLSVFSVADIMYYISITTVFLMINTKLLQSRYHA